MASSYKFICKNCTYQARTTVAVERSLHVDIAPMICKQCQILTTVVLLKKLVSNDLIPEPYECHNCLSGDYLVSWDVMSCPKCSGKMLGVGLRSIPFEFKAQKKYAQKRSP